jgi:hypothetical protein
MTTPITIRMSPIARKTIIERNVGYIGGMGTYYRNVEANCYKVGPPTAENQPAAAFPSEPI